MIKKTFVLLLSLLFVSPAFVRADEGMWIPLLLGKYNIKQMQAKGFKLTAEDIYSINHKSMKDAVMIFGGGCTGELISDKGLLITNYHCGYSAIQSHSSVEHDYLTDGFWAMSQDEELENKGLTVTFLVYMEDVTDKILKGIDDNMSEKQRQDIIEANSAKVEAEAVKKSGNKYNAKVKSFFYGNQYFLFVTQVYKDVRLVGAPPSAIGKFGGDTDNWMWPRHTGDFSLFRIYADKDNNPAEYSPENVPYKPKYYFPISIKGVKKGDFTMVFGYPGHTQEYIPSYAVEMITQVENPNRIKIREAKLDIIEKYMNSDKAIRIKYASKQASIANAWKKWIGENRGLKRLNAIEKKRELENNFNAWAKENGKKQYLNILPEYKDIYSKITPYMLARDMFIEAFYYTDLSKITGIVMRVFSLNKDMSDSEIDDKTTSILNSINGFFKDYDLNTDIEVTKAAFGYYFNVLDKNFLPAKVDALIKEKYNGDLNKFVDGLYSSSVVVDKQKAIDFVKEYALSVKDKKNNSLFGRKKRETLADKMAEIADTDLAFVVYNDFFGIYSYEIAPVIGFYRNRLDSLNRVYMKALMEMEKDKVFYPDANFTLRVAYGQVDTYYPKDGVKYNYFTTLKGIMEKDNPDIYDYRVPEKLKQLYYDKDYGRYADADGLLHVCFIASNHTTGGNSGSPVINAEGQLIGVNFDRNWEGTMSDIMYDSDMCRNITLDIRYVLFLIDKYAGASYLLDEMNIIE